MGVQIDRILKDLAVINSFGASPGKGITRFTFSKEYMSARSYVIEELRKSGAKVTNEIGGNL